MELAVLQKDMVTAMKAKDKVRKEAISSLISAVKKVAIDEGCRDDISEEIVGRVILKEGHRDDIKPELVDQVILKELKTVKEQIDTCPAERTDLIEEYRTRYNIINEYAPQLMSAEEVKICLQEKFAEVLATKNKGQIMKAVMGELKGKADGKVINQVVGELCK